MVSPVVAPASASPLLARVGVTGKAVCEGCETMRLCLGGGRRRTGVTSRHRRCSLGRSARMLPAQCCCPGTWISRLSLTLQRHLIQPADSTCSLATLSQHRRCRSISAAATLNGTPQSVQLCASGRSPRPRLYLEVESRLQVWGFEDARVLGRTLLCSATLYIRRLGLVCGRVNFGISCGFVHFQAHLFTGVVPAAFFGLLPKEMINEQAPPAARPKDCPAIHVP
jgi:hypothetical protein